MRNKLIVLCTAVVILAGGLFAYNTFFHRQTEDAETQSAHGTLSLMDDSKIVFPQLTVSYGKYKDIPASPYLIASVTDDYSLAEDEVRDILVNYKSEGAYLDPQGIARLGAMTGTEEFVLGNIETNEGFINIELPEPPIYISGGVYYSHSVGIKPTYLDMQWTMPKSNDPELWKKAAEKAGLKAFTDDNVVERNEVTGTEVCVTNYKNNDGTLIMEITWGRGIVKEEIGETVISADKKVPRTPEGEEIKPATIEVRFVVTTKADMEVRKMYSEDLKYISDKITEHGIINMMGFEWRSPVTIPSFRCSNRTSLFGMDFITLSDKRLYGFEDVPLLSCYLEVWNNYVISWSSAMLKSDWDKIKTGFLKEISGKETFTEDELTNGLNCDNGINIVVREAETFGNSNEKVVAVMISDRFADNLISAAFDKYSAVYVDGLRANVSNTLKNDNVAKEEKETPQKKEAPIRITPPKADLNKD